MSFFTNNRWIAIFTLVLITANIVTLAFLWTGKQKGDNNNKMNPPPGGGQVFEFINKELALDSLQQIAYKKLRDEHQQTQRPLQDSIRMAKDNFFALLQQPAVTATDINAMNAKIAAAEEQLNMVTFTHFQKLRALCTTEQQKKFDTIIKDVLRRMAPPRGPRPGGPPPGMDEEGRRPPPPGEDGPPPGQQH